VTNGNRLGRDEHSLDAVRRLTASYRFPFLSSTGERKLMTHFVVKMPIPIPLPRMREGRLQHHHNGMLPPLMLNNEENRVNYVDE
jgi:hypothetical protein